jgi:hypothetical protein
LFGKVHSFLSPSIVIVPALIILAAAADNTVFVSKLYYWPFTKSVSFVVIHAGLLFHLFSQPILDYFFIPTKFCFIIVSNIRRITDARLATINKAIPVGIYRQIPECVTRGGTPTASLRIAISAGTETPELCHTVSCRIGFA